MDDGKILLANLSKGLIGETNSTLLGALLVTKLQLAMSQVEIEEEKDRFFLYIDEFQIFPLILLPQFLLKLENIV